MQGNDLSNEPVPRLLFVFEGLIGNLPDKRKAQESFAVKTHRWEKAVRYWDIDSRMVAHMWDIVWRHRFSFDVVTFKPEPFAEALTQRFEQMRLPVSWVQAYESSDALSRELPYMPDVYRVFDGEASRQFHWGSKGHIVADPMIFDPIG